MANTYYQMYVQTVFSAKYRNALLMKAWQQETFAVIGNLINETGCKTIIVNGMHDHVHCFFGIMPSLSVSDVMKSVKSKSSKWLNESNYLEHRFEWQPGFGSFTYSHSHIDSVIHYIRNQEKHHKKLTFREEYIRLLRSFKIDFDERYIFHDPI